jgi:hypothetical protein
LALEPAADDPFEDRPPAAERGELLVAGLGRERAQRGRRKVEEPKLARAGGEELGLDVRVRLHDDV